jgi:ribonuclease P/MRP protein subunit RPP20
MLVASLPEILPFPAEEIRTEVLTGTVDVQDELVPDDEDEDISYRTRAKSSLSVVVIIGDGVDESTVGGSKWGPRGKRRKRAAAVWPRTEDAAASQPGSPEGDEQSDSVES